MSEINQRFMRYYITLLLLLISTALRAQFLVLNYEEDIIVYPSDSTDVVLAILPHMFVNDDDNDYSWTAKVLSVGEHRFKLEIDLDDSMEPMGDPIIGWVDKKQCGVFLRANRYEGRIAIMDIYMSKSLDGDFIPFDVYSINFEWVSVTDLYYHPGRQKYIYKVHFSHEGALYSGWVPRSCHDIYNSCN